MASADPKKKPIKAKLQLTKLLKDSYYKFNYL
jgi:hypothetical protein